MTAKVVVFDMVHIDCCLDLWDLVQLSEVVVDIRVVHNTFTVGLEINYVNLVKSNQGHEKTDIGFSQCTTCEVPVLGKNIFHIVKSFKDICDCLIVSLLSTSKSTSVNTIIDLGVYP